VDLVELIEYAGLLLFGDPWAGVRDTNVEVTVHRLGSDTDLAHIGEFDGVAYEIKQHLG
jgi:hypothetical protein